MSSYYTLFVRDFCLQCHVYKTLSVRGICYACHEKRHCRCRMCKERVAHVDVMGLCGYCNALVGGIYVSLQAPYSHQENVKEKE